MDTNKDKGELSAEELVPNSLAYDLAKSKQTKNLLGSIRKETRATLLVLKSWKIEDISKLQLKLEKDRERFGKLKEKISTGKKKRKPTEDRGPEERKPEEKKPQEKKPEEKKPQEKRPSPEEDAKRKADFEKERATRYRQLRERGVPPEEAKRRAYDDTVRAQKPKDRLKIIRKSGDPYNRERIYQSQYNALVRRGYTGWDAIEGATRSTAIIQRIKLLEEKNKLQNEIKTPKPTGGFKLPELPKLKLPEAPKLNIPKPQLPKLELPKLKLPDLNPEQFSKQTKLNKFVGKIFDIFDVKDLGESIAKKDVGGALTSAAGLLANIPKLSKLAYAPAAEKLTRGDVTGAGLDVLFTKASGRVISGATNLAARFPALSGTLGSVGRFAGPAGWYLTAAQLSMAAQEMRRKKAEPEIKKLENEQKKAEKSGNWFDWFSLTTAKGQMSAETANPTMAGFAEGGVVTQPTLAIIGEGGEKEYIVPESKLSEFIAAQSQNNDAVRKPARMILGVVDNFISQFGSSSGDIRRMVGGDLLRLERIYGKDKFVLPVFTRGEGSFDNIIGDSFKKLIGTGGGGISDQLYDAIANLLVSVDSFMGMAGGVSGGNPGTPPGFTGAEDLFELIAGGEGGYNSVNRGNAGDTPDGAISIFGRNLTEMTVGEIVAAQQSGRVFAVGKYQIIPETMTGFLRAMNISSSDKFDENTQEKFKEYVVNFKRPEVGRYIRGESDNLLEAAQELAREFASVGLSYPEAGRPVGSSRYSGSAGNAASISPEAVQQALQKARQNKQSGTEQPTDQQRTTSPPTTDTQQGKQKVKLGNSDYELTISNGRIISAARVDGNQKYNVPTENLSTLQRLYDRRKRSVTDNVTQPTTRTTTSGSRINLENSDGSPIRSFSDLRRHHSDQVRPRDGQELLVRDVILTVGNSTDVPVPSPVNGTVTIAGPVEGFGPNAVYIKDTSGNLVIIGHMKSKMVNVGDTVTMGQPLGIQGKLDGGSSGPHVHIEAKPEIISAWINGMVTGQYTASSVSPSMMQNNRSSFSPAMRTNYRSAVNRARTNLPGLNRALQRRGWRSLSSPTPLSQGGSVVAIQPVIIQQPTPTPQAPSNAAPAPQSPTASTAYRNWVFPSIA